MARRLTSLLKQKYVRLFTTLVTSDILMIAFALSDGDIINRNYKIHKDHKKNAS